jgi:single-strand DNA-binding protein
MRIGSLKGLDRRKNMNKIVLLGRLTRDIELRQAGETSVANFSLAVNRTFKRDGEPDADFFNCVAFGKRAETLAQYVHKGNQLAIEGHVQMGQYTNKEGANVKTFDVMVDGFDFIGSKSERETETRPEPKTETPTENFDLDLEIDDLPF